MSYLLDTNHCSQWLSGSSILRSRVIEIGLDRISTSAIVAGELFYMARGSDRREQNTRRVEEFLDSLVVHPPDLDVARVYGELKGALVARFGPRSRGQRRQASAHSLGVSDNDLWIAAIAVHHGLIIVSRDGDFARLKEACPEVSFESWLS